MPLGSSLIVLPPTAAQSLLCFLPISLCPTCRSMLAHLHGIYTGSFHAWMHMTSSRPQGLSWNLLETKECVPSLKSSPDPQAVSAPRSSLTLKSGAGRALTGSCPAIGGVESLNSHLEPTPSTLSPTKEGLAGGRGEP